MRYYTPPCQQHLRDDSALENRWSKKPTAFARRYHFFSFRSTKKNDGYE
jgi:hypothetical protein